MTKAEIEGALGGIVTGTIAGGALIASANRQWAWMLACLGWFVAILVWRALVNARVARILAGWQEAIAGWRSSNRGWRDYAEFMGAVVGQLHRPDPFAEKKAKREEKPS